MFMIDAKKYLGKIVKISIDRPLGSKHPEYDVVYDVNYGFVPNTVSGDSEELDAYVLGINEPAKEFEGRCIAIIRRTDDNDDKLIIVPEGADFSDSEIERQTAFQEKWFHHIIIRRLPAIYLICGFIGFGKTTYAKNLEKNLSAIRFTHDEIMWQRYGRNPDNFQKKNKEIDEFIRRETEKEIKRGKDVILDYGFWTKEKRAAYYSWAKTVTPNVYFHAVVCDIATARRRINERTRNNPNELIIDKNCFNEFLKQYEPLTKEEGYPISFYSSENFVET